MRVFDEGATRMEGGMEEEEKRGVLSRGIAGSEPIDFWGGEKVAR